MGARTIGLGFTLQPDPQFLELCAPLLPLADYFEVAPETLWRSEDGGRLLEPNGFHAQFAALREASGKPFVAHGVGYSMGTSARSDAARRRRWRARVADDHRVFRFRWWTDHLGASSLDGRAVTLPIALPMTSEVARVVRRRLAEMRSVVPRVGVENSVACFVLGDPLDEPGFICRALGSTGHLLLDLHNVFTMGVNFDFDPLDYLARLELSKVIELHVSGGAESDPRWLRSGRTFRLDAHDSAIPEEVWRLLEWTLPRCKNLRGVTLERMEGTVSADDVGPLAAELKRLRKVIP